MRLLSCVLLSIGLIIPSIIQARPVSYPDGWTTKLMNNGDLNSALIHYSPTAKISVGYKFEYLIDKEMSLNAVQVNNLLKRWNRPDSQANLYLKSGIGLAYSDKDVFDQEINAAGFIGIAADWEDRRYFVSYENRYTDAGKITNFSKQAARVGWAPYEGDYGDFHTWLMLQVEHMPENDHPLTVTPLVRFFKDVHLFEAGINNRGKILINYVFRY